MSLRELTAAALRAKGYDGLFFADYGCACLLADLMPCGVPLPYCQAGHKAACDGSCDSGKCNFHVVAEKPKE